MRHPRLQALPQPWIGPDPAKDRQAFKFPDWNFYWPGTYEIKGGKPVSLIFREKPIASTSAEYPLTFDWNFLAAAGSLVLYAGLIAFLLMRLRGATVNFLTVYGRTLRQLALPIVTIAFILAIAQLMNYSGMTSSMAIALSKTGFIFPFVAAFLGWLGVFLTGSDTSSNTLFGPLQAQTAQQLGNVSPILTAGTNSSGGVMGKMISPQNLSVGAAGVNKVGAGGGDLPAGDRLQPHPDQPGRHRRDDRGVRDSRDHSLAVSHMTPPAEFIRRWRVLALGRFPAARRRPNPSASNPGPAAEQSSWGRTWSARPAGNDGCSAGSSEILRGPRRAR